MTLLRGDEDVWTALRRRTAARVGLERSGSSLATAPLLDFRLAHARARDAVHEALDEPRLISGLEELGLPVMAVTSAAADRQAYLMRPDLGRRLATEGATALAAHSGEYDVAFVVADGLSARAAARHATPVLARTVPVLEAEGWRIAPVVVVRRGRVAIGDAIANALNAQCVAIFIGERPGLSAPDSLGAYLTWQPGPTTSDAERNCVSNIRPEGIDYDSAAFKVARLLRAMRARRLSGVALKDDSDRLLIGS